MNLPYNAAPQNLLYYNQVKPLKLIYGQAMNYVSMKLGWLKWLTPNYSPQFFEIYKGHMMWYEDSALLKKVKRYVK